MIQLLAPMAARSAGRLAAGAARAAFVAALLVAGPASLAAYAAPVELTILHSNDTHDHLEAFDSRQGKDVGGVARRATLIKRIKADAKNVLVIDAGDVFQGTPIFTFFEGEPDMLTMQQAGYDAIAVGNHDLDNGLANLQKQAKHLAQPLLCATLVDAKGKPIFQPYRIVERGGLKIALIGIMGKNAYDAIAEKRRAGVFVKDPKQVLTELVPQLRSKVDLVIVASHTGHEEEVALASAVSGIDVIVGGHSHTKVEHPVIVLHGDRPTLVVQAFQWGEFLGRIDLTVDGGKIVKHAGGLLPVSTDIPPDPAVLKTVQSYADKIAAQMQQVVGRSDFEFLNARKADGDAPIGNLIADALRDQAKADVGIMNSGGIRAPLPKGDVTRGMVLSMLPFDNKLVHFPVSGALLQQILNFAASKSGKSGSLQVSGIAFVVEGGKAVAITVGGRPLDPAKTYRVATIDYLAAGNDGAEVFKQVPATAMTETGLLVRDAFTAYMQHHKVLQNPPGGRIQVRSLATP